MSEQDILASSMQTADAIARLVAAYRDSLIVAGIPSKLADRLVSEYAMLLWEKILHSGLAGA